MTTTDEKSAADPRNEDTEPCDSVPEMEQHQQVEAELRFLLKLIESVNAAVGFDEALKIVLEAMCVQEDCLYGEAWLPNSEGTALSLSPVFHLKESQNETVLPFRQSSEGLTIAPGEGIIGHTWQTGKLMWDEDVPDLLDKNDLRAEAQTVAKLQPLLAVPIMAADKIVAVLLLYKDRSGTRNKRFLALAEAAATQLGFVLQQKRSEMLLQQAHNELEERVNRRTLELQRANLWLEALVKEREAAEKHLQQRNQELELLHRFSLLITGRLDIDKILQSFVTLLREEMHTPGGFVFFYDRRRQQIYPQLSWGLLKSEAQAMMYWPLEKNPLFQGVTENDVILQYHLKDNPFFVEQKVIEAHPTWQSFVGVPVIAGDKVHGAFGLFRRAPTTFRAGEINFLKALAQVIRTAVQNARLFESVNHNREQLRLIAQRVFTTQESERRRVSRELHDEAGQALTGLNMHLQMVWATLKQLENDVQSSLLTGLEEQIETAVSLCQTTLDHIRTIAQDLRPAALENLGLDTALRAFCRDFARRTQLTITYTGQSSVADLPESVEIGLYRFLQEALTNVARHAQAQRVEVQLHYDTNTISLTVTDDGRGFNVPVILGNTAYRDGVGLVGMKERIESVGGQLTITSELSKGSSLIAWVPL